MYIPWAFTMLQKALSISREFLIMIVFLKSIANHNSFSLVHQGIRKIVEHCKQLQIVLLRRCELIEDTAVSLLATSCPNLTQLCLDGCKGVTDSATECLGKYSSKMKYLDISRTQVSYQFSIVISANWNMSDCLYKTHINCI